MLVSKGRGRVAGAGGSLTVRGERGKEEKERWARVKTNHVCLSAL